MQVSLVMLMAFGLPPKEGRGPNHVTKGLELSVTTSLNSREEEQWELNELPLANVLIIDDNAIKPP